MRGLRSLLPLLLLWLCATPPVSSQDAAKESPPLPLVISESSFDSGDPLEGGVHEVMSLFFDRVYHWVPTETGPQLRPSLAKAMPEYSADGLTATIALRKDIAFNGITEFDGRAELRVRAQDVVANVKSWLKMDRHRGGLADALCWQVQGCEAYRKLAKLNTSWTALDLKAPISGLTCKDDFTLVVQLTRPSQMLPWIFAHSGAVIWPAEAFAEGRRDIKDEWISAASGPYSFIGRKESDGIERNPGFRGEPSDCPEFDLRPIGHRAAPVELKKQWAEKPCGYWELGGNHAGVFLDSEADPTVLISRTEELHYLAINMDDKLWGGLDEHGCGLRNTVFHAMDPTALLKDLNQSGPFAPANGPSPEIRGLHSPWQESHWKPQGPEEARKLLRATKYSAGQNPDDGSALQLKILCPDAYFARLFEKHLEPLLVKAGIGVLIEAATSSSNFLDRITKGDYTAVYYGWRNDWPDHADMLLRLHSRRANCDVNVRVPCRLENKELDALLDATEAIDPLEREKRAEAIIKVTAWLAKHRPYVPVTSPMRVRLVGTDTVMPELPWSAGNTFRYLKRN